MTQKYNVFISYRRDGGESTAKILRDKLESLGYQVFFDVESLRSGDFNTALYSVIDECEDFLLILSPGALDRCRNEDDWVRLEIEHALAKNKNIIPIMLRGFSFPKELPDSIDKLRYKNGIESNYQFFDAFIEKLQSFLKSKPGVAHQLKRNPIYKKILPVIIILLSIILAGAAATALKTSQNPSSSRTESKSYPQTDAEKNLTKSLLYYVQLNMQQLEQSAEYLDNSYQACSQYLVHINTADRASLLAELQKNRRLLYQLDTDLSLMSEELNAGLMDSPFSAADASAMHDYLLQFQESCITNIYYMEYLTSDEAYIDLEVKEDILSNYREVFSEELKSMSYSTNLLLLPIKNEEVIKDFKYSFLPQLYYIPLQASDWSENEAALISAEDKSWNAISRIMDRITIQIGEDNMELMKTKAELIEQLVAEGATEEEARQLVESLSANSQLLTEKQADLAVLSQELEARLEEAKKKFAPTAEDDADTLWGKMLRFMNLGLYDEAVTCIDAYREKVRADDEYAESYCACAALFIKNISRTGIDYGLIVVGYEPDKPKNEQYEIGDVIISICGTPCHNFEEYNSIKSSVPPDEAYTVVVLRAAGDESGTLTQTELLIPADAPRVQIREMTEKTYE